MRGCMRFGKMLLVCGLLLTTLGCIPLPGSHLSTTRPGTLAIAWVVASQSGSMWETGDIDPIRLVDPAPMLRLRFRITPVVSHPLADGSYQLDDTPLLAGVEYQLCVKLEADCQPAGDWIAASADGSPKLLIELQPDWMGDKALTIKIHFRDANGQALPSVNLKYETGVSQQPAKDVSGVTYTIRVEPMPTSTPQVALTQTYEATALLVTGSIDVAPGRSVIGGEQGSIQKVMVVFSAFSRAGKVTQMRVNEAEWEPFVAQKEYSVTMPINWFTISYCVQYQDDQGNLSPKICGNKPGEGSPAQPTQKP